MFFKQKGRRANRVVLFARLIKKGMNNSLFQMKFITFSDGTSCS